MARLVALCKRRGFVFPASEIYGGLNGFWDFGPLGTQLKNNLRDAWWRDMVECPPLGPDGKPLSIVGLDSAIIQHPTTWKASGHVGTFADLMVDCRETKLRYRADHILTIPIYEEKLGQPVLYLAALSGDALKGELLKKIQKLAKKKKDFFINILEVNDEDEILRPSTALNEAIELLQNISVGFLNILELTKLSEVERTKVIGPDAETKGTLTEPRAFNLMFHSYVGVFQDEDSKVYLRPETAQGIFLNYKNVLDTSRVRPPFGIAQIGKSYRNEITPRNFIFRTREFEQMEMEFFCHPDDGMMWYEFWVAERLRWWEAQGVKKSNLFRHVIPADELAHYSKGTSDIEYLYPFTAPNFGELEGVAYRTDYDLKQHAQFSKVGMDYIDQEKNERYVPHVVEPASGLTRGVLVLLCEGYQYDESRASPEWLKIKPSLAPIKLGIFPLVNKDSMPEVAEKLYLDLRRDYICQYDAKQSIGKRYARMDEAGTPFCITVDGDTLQDQQVTVRNRDTAQQERVALSQLRAYLAEKFRD
jgi:glycyl-tRNA synthetase